MLTLNTFRSSQELLQAYQKSCSVKKRFLKNFSKCTGKHLFWSLLFNEVTALTCNFIQKWTSAQVSSFTHVNQCFCIVRATFSTLIYCFYLWLWTCHCLQRRLSHRYWRRSDILGRIFHSYFTESLFWKSREMSKKTPRKNPHNFWKNGNKVDQAIECLRSQHFSPKIPYLRNLKTMENKLWLKFT